MNNIFPLLLTTVFAAPLLAPKTAINIGGVEYNQYSVKEVLATSHCRYHDAGEESDKPLPGVNWEYEEVPAISSVDASYFRYVVNAPIAGTYHVIYSFVGGDYYLCNYVNSSSNYSVVSASGSWSSYTNQTFEMNLLSGENVIALQINNWGALKDIFLESSLTLVRQEDTSAKYYFANQYNNESPLYYENGGIFDANATISVGPLKYDNDVSFLSKNIVNVHNIDGTKSINLNYCTKSASGDTPISLSVNGGAYTSITLPASNNAFSTFNISQDTLTLLGYDFTNGAENTLTFVPTSASHEKIVLKDLVLSTQSASEVLKDISISEIKNKAYVMGRSLYLNDAIALDWSASNIQLDFTGEGSVYAKLLVSGQDASFVAEVDGNPYYVTAPVGENNIRLVEGLEYGNHTLRLFKASEANGYLAELKGMTVNESIELAVTERNFDYRFEFYGDSTCCANQIASETEDAYMSFSRILGDVYNANWNNLCVSGRGLYSGYNSEIGWLPTHDDQINKLYKYTSYFRNNEDLWDFSSYQPDVLVVDLGNNDLGKNIMSVLNFGIEDFTNEVKRWHQEVRELYPNTEIIYMYGLYENRDYENEYRAAIEELKAGGDNKVTFLYTPYLGQGIGSHPNYVEHDLLARYLSEIISNKLGVEDPLGLTRRLEMEDAEITGRYTTRTAGEDWERWSNGKYIGNTGPEKAITSASEITTDGKTVKLFSFNVSVEESGRYAFRVAYSTQADDSTIYYRLGNENSGTYHPLRLKGTGSWATPLTYSEPMYVDLTSGNNEFIVTGPTTSSSWANYDYIQYYKVVDDGRCYISAPYSSLYTFEDLPSSVNPGDSVAFRINVSENASQSYPHIRVYADHVLISKDAEDYYHINNITHDVHIDIQGIDRNSWTVTYKDGDTVIKTESWKVGDNVSYSGLKNKNHYRFVGWEPETPNSMPNHDITLKAVWEYDESVIVDDPLLLPIIIASSAGGVALVGVGIFLIKFLKKRKVA